MKEIIGLCLLLLTVSCVAQGPAECRCGDAPVVQPQKPVVTV